MYKPRQTKSVYAFDRTGMTEASKVNNFISRTDENWDKIMKLFKVVPDPCVKMDNNQMLN